MEFGEAPKFTQIIYDYLNEDEYRALQWELALHPEAGTLIPNSGGVRKIRWSLSDRGKRGGIRVIYYYKSSDAQIWLLTIYAENELDNIPAPILRKVKEELLK